jgi:hypothetical protein
MPSPAFGRTTLARARRVEVRREARELLDRFEHRSEPLLPAKHFFGRVARFSALAGAVIAGSLALGTAGYHQFASLPWIDALLNAAMILTGMGPVDRMETSAGKLFAAGYALFSGIAFVSTIALLFAPLIHRFFHALHLEEPTDEGRGDLGS